jgi:hypothetical protein
LILFTLSELYGKTKSYNKLPPKVTFNDISAYNPTQCSSAIWLKMKIWPGMVAYAYKPSSAETEAEGSRIPDLKNNNKNNKHLKKEK